MKKTQILFSLLIVSALSLLAQEVNYSKLTGPYLGQKPPDTVPEIFAPGIVSTENGWEAAISFSPDLGELLVTEHLLKGWITGLCTCRKLMMFGLNQNLLLLPLI